jgi:aquaporin Z
VILKNKKKKKKKKKTFFFLVISHVAASIFRAMLPLFYKAVAECVGTFFLCLSAVLSGSPPATLLVFVFACGHLSGAHFNPAVTVGIALYEKWPIKWGVVYLAAQMLGAGIAFLVAYFTDDGFVDHDPLPKNNQFVKLAVGEFIGTLALVFIVVNVALLVNKNDFYGLAIGLTVYSMGTTLAPLTKYGFFNPAVASTVLAIGIVHPLIAIVIPVQLLAGVLGMALAAIGGHGLKRLRDQEQSLREAMKAAPKPKVEDVERKGDEPVGLEDGPAKSLENVVSSESDSDADKDNKDKAAESESADEKK